MDMWRYEFSP